MIQLSIIGAIVAVLGLAFKAGWAIGIGVLLFFSGFFIVATPTLPWYVWGVIILLIIFIITGGGKK
jgi:hypothetical protein